MKTTRRNLMIGGASVAAAAALPVAQRAAAQDATTITWWHISTNAIDQALFQQLADDYVADHPNVTIEITVLENEAFKQRLTTAMQSGDPPDIFQSWGGGVLYEYASAGLVKDITADLQTDGWGDSFVQAGLGLYGRDGAYFGVPWRLAVVAFWYNKALFAQAGIEAPPATWEEFLTTVSTLKDAGITPISVGEGDRWPGHFFWVYLATRTGGEDAFMNAYARNGSFADESFVEAGRLLQELVALEPFQDGFLGASYPDAATVMGNGQAAMELMGPWAPGVYADNAENGVGLGDDLGNFLFPSLEGGAGDPTDILGGADGFAIGANASPEAIDFVRFLTSAENQSFLAGEGIAILPTVTAAEDAITDPIAKELAELARTANYLQLYYDQFLPPAVGQTVNDAVQGIFAGTLSPEEVAQQIEDVAAQELAG
ncbi:MAG: extracellular solute-binding protein [Thermomicrobiales bacterium]|jgi:raffinose/stachyose/melibiose transport system substrate-binding protein|nr:extracellular solute-binding protein [Thermomicrobiales bacterium]